MTHYTNTNNPVDFPKIKEKQMNERIKELAMQSGFKVDWQHEDVQTIKMARFEKFAELLLKQCLSYIDDSFGDVDYVQFMIKRDFGVETGVGIVKRAEEAYESAKKREMSGDHKISGDGKACVDHDYYWRPLETAPHGVKVQLLSIYGVASHGLLSSAIIEEGFWIGWTPLPKRRKEND